MAIFDRSSISSFSKSIISLLLTIATVSPAILGLASEARQRDSDDIFGLSSKSRVKSSQSKSQGDKFVLIPFWTRSYELYHQPHAIWLNGDTEVGVNLGPLNHVLTAAEAYKQVPEIVIYAIPLRDLGQSSEGGFRNYDDYLADNRLLASAIKAFVEKTSLKPKVYLEPDALSLAIDFRKTHQNNAESMKIYQDRTSAISQLVRTYQNAGAEVYLDGAHSGWFDYSDADVQAIAQALNEAGMGEATGLVTNVSNRQKLRDGESQSEFHYLQRLTPLLKNSHPDLVVDTSRNGGETHPRIFYLAPNGNLIDNELAGGRLVGQWRREEDGEIYFNPFWGKQKTLSALLKKEKYQFNIDKMILIAPPWLDPIGDVKLGHVPTDSPPASVNSVIHRLRYIKPPDDCDGSLNCPPGESKHDINVKTMRMQPPKLFTDKTFWDKVATEISYK